jgi:eukaryotic-like serine/threonine-protein kinase
VSTSLEQLESLFSEAAAQPPAKREAFLATACAGNPALRARVEKFLRSHAAIGGFLESPVLPELADLLE